MLALGKLCNYVSWVKSLTLLPSPASSTTPAISPPGICVSISHVTSHACCMLMSRHTNLGQVVLVSLAHLEIYRVYAGAVLLDENLAIRSLRGRLFFDFQNGGIARLVIDHNFVLRRSHISSPVTDSIATPQMVFSGPRDCPGLVRCRATIPYYVSMFCQI